MSAGCSKLGFSLCRRILEYPIVLRFTESQNRQKAIEDFQRAMFAGRTFLIEATKNVTEAKAAVEASTPEKPVAPPRYTDSDLDEVKALLKEHEVSRVGCWDF